MSILVTGAAGFIGSHLSEHLSSLGRAVVGLDSFDTFYDPAIKRRNLRRARTFEAFREVRGDIRDRELLDGLPDDVDAVIHLAALAGVRPSIEDPVRYQDVNVTGTATLLEWARERGIRTFLFGSSSSVYGNSDDVPFSENADVGRPISPYAASKRAGEVLCHTYHHLHEMTIVCLRFFTVFGPRQRPDLAIHKFARLLASGEEIPMYGDGTTERDYTYIDDILQGVRGALQWVEDRAEPSFEIVNLGESRTVPLRRMIEVIADEMGETARIRRLPKQPGDVDRTWADVTRARALFGYDPKWDFREGVREFVQWYVAERETPGGEALLATPGTEGEPERAG